MVGNNLIDKGSIIVTNSQVCEEAEIIESILSSSIFVDKYTRIEHSKLGEKVRIERNNQIVYSYMGRYCYTGANTVIKNAWGWSGNWCFKCSYERCPTICNCSR